MSVQVKKFRAALKHGAFSATAILQRAWSGARNILRRFELGSSYSEEKAQALALWNDRLLGIIRGKTAAKVLPPKRTKRGRG